MLRVSFLTSFVTDVDLEKPASCLHTEPGGGPDVHPHLAALRFPGAPTGGPGQARAGLLPQQAVTDTAPPQHSIRGDTPGLTPSPSPGVAPVELRGRRDFCHPEIARSPLPPGLSVEATKDMKHRGGNKGLGPPPPAREAAEEVQGRAGTSPHPCVPTEPCSHWGDGSRKQPKQEV